ncbi:hypothetical protein R1flu_018458 [Riccia fluitans]|uniref:Uncharacterized protein n=1 Tax=Riccia fluitans TaxID=41844 RepID=A0ABD1ZH83_9MARC
MGVASKLWWILKVRRTWQLDPNRVSFEDTKWCDGLAVLTTQIAKRLGCLGVDLDVDLYKFLLYEPGGHFAKHRDTEKHHRMFATSVKQPMLAITPCITPMPSMQSNLSSKDTDWFLSIQSAGPRLPKRVHPVLGAEMQGKIATQINVLHAEKRPFHYFLEHDYTPKSISAMDFQALKGKDRDRVVVLSVANSTIPFEQQFNFLHAKVELRTGYYGNGVNSKYHDELIET